MLSDSTRRNGHMVCSVMSISFLSVLICSCLFCGCKSLGVYSLCEYENNWKPSLSGYGPAHDPYYDFWDEMTSGPGGDGYARKSTSERYRDSEVTIRTILPIPGDDLKSWDGFQFVFFWGHNNTIVPPHGPSLFDYHLYEGHPTPEWNPKTGYLDQIDWGDTINFDYYAVRPITIADEYPGALTYLYHEYTASLLGYPYDYCGSAKLAGFWEGFPSLYLDGYLPWRERWHDQVQELRYGQLGDKRLNWLVLHGCQAVITANLDGSYNPLGLRCFDPIQGRFHLVLGHYHWKGTPEPLVAFALKLVNGNPVQEAYFSVHPGLMASAIAAEDYPFPGWGKSTMLIDRWTDPVKDIEDARCFTMRWLVQVGTLGQEWDEDWDNPR